jgi:hypothetical protein
MILEKKFSPRHFVKNFWIGIEMRSRRKKIVKENTNTIKYKTAELVTLEIRLKNPAYVSIAGTSGIKTSPKLSTHFVHNVLAVKVSIPTTPYVTAGNLFTNSQVFLLQFFQLIFIT